MPRSILIVDDDFALAEMLRELLLDYGHEVSLALNGRLALDLLAERRIDLVLTDVMMPVMDGSELAAAMRGSEDHRRIPIVMMTSLLSAVPRGDAGLYDALLRKPFTPDELLQVIQASFGRGPGGDGANN